MERNEVIIKIGGPAGSGVNSLGHILSKFLQREGLYIYSSKDYPSLIKGGHNTYTVRAESKKIESSLDHIDILIALDEKTIDLHSNELSKNGAIICDSSFKIKGKTGVHLSPIPIKQLSKKFNGKYINSITAGACLGLLQLDLTILDKILKQIFSGKSEKIIKDNILAAKLSHDYVLKNFKYNFPHKIKKIKSPLKIFLSGNEAVALASIKAGCKFISAYPMTPATSILHVMANNDQKYNIVVKQTEDELAAINMAIGASFTGVRSMTATSGGGFALMTEALGLAGISETPLVIIESQRAGPSTGLPTYTDQSDLRFVLHASQGEFPKIVLCPGDIEECYHQTFHAFNLAEKYQTPVIVMIDKTLSESYSTINYPNNNLKINRGKLLSNEQASKIKNYKRHQFTQDGISLRAIPGQKNCYHICSSYEHDETGFTSEDPINRMKMLEKRERKLEKAGKEIKGYKIHGKNSKNLVVSWGSCKTPILETQELMKNKFSLLQIICVSPFPSKEVKNILNKSKNLIIVEGNQTAQLAGIIKEKIGIDIKNKILKYDGRPFSVDYIHNELKKRLK
ncbi:2-oxoacid:acceptor oxidoreductase subunit alpha [archaeon]|nr:2-oxoacid:acceptor oxidoreductase subunit alpha [archaeon]